MEASSHGLDQYRLDGVRMTAAAFTNLSRDHLDYHGTEAAYLAAKRRLFDELLPDDGPAVLNADVPQFETFGASVRARGLTVLAYGQNGAEIRLVERRPLTDGQALKLQVQGQDYEVLLPLPGDFQAYNALAALGLALATGLPADSAVAGLAKLIGVPGRLERVARSPQGASVYVDYAHTPDALRCVLEALRPHAGERLQVVVGCGGDRDRGKRPQMGEIAQRLADRVIVTDDNPRGEDPAAIRQDVLAGAPGAQEIGDRGAAIQAAVAGLGANDLLVIAGKGHEPGQIIGDEVLPFDDREVARAAAERVWGNVGDDD